MNLWHDIEPGTKEAFTVVVEVPRGSKNKYEIDKKTGLIRLDRVMHTSQDMPFDYGFVPKTLWHDGDPLDVVILTTYPLYPGILVSVRPVGILNMIDSGESDAKILAVPTDDPRWSKVKDIEDINEHTIKELTHYFHTYKQIQNKEVKIESNGNAKDAMSAFEESINLYKEKYQK